MFNIRDYFDKLDNVTQHFTWYEATCPVCSGKLKVSKSYPKAGSYACYTGNCHTLRNSRGVNLIRAALETVSPFTQYSSPFKQSRRFKVSTVLRPTPIPVTAALHLESKVQFVRPKVEEFISKSQRKIYFDYGEFQLVRVETGGEVNSKYVYPIHYPDDSGFYVKSLPAVVECPFYRSNYISPDLVIVEGEKCATYCQAKGISTISIYTPFSSSFMLDELLVKLYARGVRNIVYLEDNDVAGRVKATKLLDSAWKVNIAASTINITDLYPDYSTSQGFDIVDLYNEGKIRDGEDIVQLIQRGLERLNG